MNTSIVVAIDFGLTYTGAAFIYPSVPFQSDDIRVVRRWPSYRGIRTHEKAPSAIAYPAYNPQNRERRWGFQIRPGMTASAWTKFQLDDEASEELLPLRTGPWARAGGAFWLPNDKSPIQVTADFLAEIYRYVMRELQTYVTRMTRGNRAPIPVEFWFSVPNLWPEQAKQRMRQAAIMAGFGTGLRGQAANLCFVNEAQADMAYVISCSSSMTFPLLPQESVLICDCGGGTTDVSSFLITGIEPYSYEETTAASRVLCGATTVQRALYALMIERFGNAFLNVPLSSRAPGSSFMVSFEEQMAGFTGQESSDMKLPLPMSSHRTNSVWYRNGWALLSVEDMKRLYQPTLETICRLLNRQMAAAPRNINRIFLVGGFSLCPYVLETISDCFLAPNGKTIVHQPENPQLATVRGSVLWGTGVLRPATLVTECHFGIEPCMAICDFENANFTFLDAFSSGRSVTNDINWLVHKGYRYTANECGYDDVTLVYKHGDFPTKAINIYSSTLDAAPAGLNHRGVSLAVPVLCNLSELNLDLTPRREVNGCLFHLVECKVRMTLGDNDGLLHFDVSSQGMLLNDPSIGLRLG
ncbi:actin-like ATPase domain-containing protein [Aspergillus steynii IBT 23096]|uniref:Actin-like ATPase domain-containing protein n=1 Tax=Aspergillus steynii IBT 23096 TaxID=1392250 RepID=A0A2I2GF94_9EURO|nr:actin-like ATPase domain-containing protein [Aspergillus steynii IBT 23096]PLB51550.1 actin-like ATPase domain-containing protein [Aspergillus steynii IBT 23096]